MSATAAGIAAPEHAAKREELLALLTTAYWMEIETVTEGHRRLFDGFLREYELAATG